MSNPERRVRRKRSRDSEGRFLPGPASKVPRLDHRSMPPPAPQSYNLGQFTAFQTVEGDRMAEDYGWVEDRSYQTGRAAEDDPEWIDRRRRSDVPSISPSRIAELDERQAQDRLAGNPLARAPRTAFRPLQPGPMTGRTIPARIAQASSGQARRRQVPAAPARVAQDPPAEARFRQGAPVSTRALQDHLDQPQPRQAPLAPARAAQDTPAQARLGQTGPRQAHPRQDYLYEQPRIYNPFGPSNNSINTQQPTAQPAPDTARPGEDNPFAQPQVYWLTYEDAIRSTQPPAQPAQTPDENDVRMHDSDVDAHQSTKAGSANQRDPTGDMHNARAILEQMAVPQDEHAGGYYSQAESEQTTFPQNEDAGDYYAQEQEQMAVSPSEDDGRYYAQEPEQTAAPQNEDAGRYYVVDENRTAFIREYFRQNPITDVEATFQAYSQKYHQDLKPFDHGDETDGHLLMCICLKPDNGQLYMECDNGQHCMKQFFHPACLGYTAFNTPTDEERWYCPDCVREGRGGAAQYKEQMNIPELKPRLMRRASTGCVVDLTQKLTVHGPFAVETKPYSAGLDKEFAANPDNLRDINMSTKAAAMDSLYARAAQPLGHPVPKTPQRPAIGTTVKQPNKNSWSKWEDDALIDSIREATEQGLNGQPLWDSLSDKLAVRGVNRKIGGARNRWMRGLREATRIDERRKKNSRKMTTAIQVHKDLRDPNSSRAKKRRPTVSRKNIKPVGTRLPGPSPLRQEPMTNDPDASSEDTPIGASNFMWDDPAADTPSPPPIRLRRRVMDDFVASTPSPPAAGLRRPVADDDSDMDYEPEGDADYSDDM